MVGGGGLVVGGGSICGDFGGVMLISSPELANCAPPLSEHMTAL